MQRSVAIVLIGFALLAAACSSDDASDDASSSPSGTEAVTTVTPAEATPEQPADETPATETSLAAADLDTAAEIEAYVAEAAAFTQAGADAQIPEGLEPQAGGAPGYTRYVFRENGAGVVPTLVEGPIGQQARCQTPDMPCSYEELGALQESGAAIPDALGLDDGELGALVDELDQLNGFLVAHADVNTACEAGFISDRIQTANMGSHFYNVASFANGFDPGEPEILLYARADGEMHAGPLGQCRDGVWDGPEVALVGSAFILPPQVVGEDHPEAFTGDLDNWHIHYNLCHGNASGRDSFVPREQCEAGGGNFSEAIGWMMHAWVAPGYENDLGVFSMWNSSIAPLTPAEAVYETRLVTGDDFPDGARQSIVTNFAFDSVIEADPGQPIYFNNSDSVPHTVTAGTSGAPSLDLFDSGVLMPGANYDVTIEAPGEYQLFCSLHPDMTATIVVG